MKRIKLLDFLTLYNFKYYNENIEEDYDTDVVRIYYDDDDASRWLELGANSWYGIDRQNRILIECLNTNLLNMYVYSFKVDRSTDNLYIYVQKEREIIG